MKANEINYHRRGECGRRFYDPEQEVKRIWNRNFNQLKGVRLVAYNDPKLLIEIAGKYTNTNGVIMLMTKSGGVIPLDVCLIEFNSVEGYSNEL